MAPQYGHVQALINRLRREMDQEHLRMEWWSKRNGFEAAEEISDIKNEIYILEENIRNARRITQS